MYPWVLSLPSNIAISRVDANTVGLRGPTASWRLGAFSPELESALRAGASRQQLEEATMPEQQAKLAYTLSQLDEAGLLCRSVLGEDGARLATWVPLVPGAVFDGSKLAKGALSRFAFLRRREGRSVLESPLRAARLILHDWRATALLAAYPETPALLAPAQMAALLCLMANCGLMDGEDDPPLWDFHSLLFHARSRAGRSPGPHGVAYRRTLEEVEDEQPGLALPIPDRENLAASDLPFLEVVERRRSRREHAKSTALDLVELAEFLWRSAREQDGQRPYPSAGKAYEIEVSLVAHRCADLPSGVYRYQSRSHRLRILADADGRALLDDARRALGASALPQILVILSARFAQMSSKYRAIAYSNVLKDVGVMLQTMALTASAMDLAACPLGTGDSDLFCQVFGTDYAVESSVGELTLGRPLEG